jgi:LysM repeat protein
MTKNSPQNVIDSYRKRQHMLPFVVGGLAVLLVAVGIIILIVWFTGSNPPSISLFATETPTPTNTATQTPVTPTVTPTETATITITATVTETLTPTGPFEYTVKDKDTCWDIATSFKVQLEVLLAINNFGAGCPIKPGDKILIPVAGQELPTETPIPSDIAKGTKIQYTIKVGDTLAAIASRFRSTAEAIMQATNDYNQKNNLPAWKDAAKIYAGQILVIPIGIVTPTSTRQPSSTKNASTPTVAQSATPKK